MFRTNVQYNYFYASKPLQFYTHAMKISSAAALVNKYNTGFSQTMCTQARE